ncbi:hypothetical protein Syun_027902 [Stephania yunnanensis]|uniref:Uncharacterized protein n=1 Tax=Stephania yunnanensis TaxID=152371 RepID=A0AAP0EGD5_9MAGN
MKGVDSMAMPEGSTLYELIQTGITHTHASVGVLVRLRKELSLVKDIPVLIAIDQVTFFMQLHCVPYSEHLSFLELREFVQLEERTVRELEGIVLYFSLINCVIEMETKILHLSREGQGLPQSFLLCEGHAWASNINNNNNNNNREEKESPNNSCSSLGRKVGRSRSVGCGSRSMSFSGDFLERLSTGFGDCTVLRRVESHWPF